MVAGKEVGAKMGWIRAHHQDLFVGTRRILDRGLSFTQLDDGSVRHVDGQEGKGDEQWQKQ